MAARTPKLPGQSPAEPMRRRDEHALGRPAGRPGLAPRRARPGSRPQPLCDSGPLVDEELVRLAQGGDRRAFDLLTVKYQGRLTKLVARYVRDSADAADVVQESFLKAFRSLGAFRRDSAFYTWLYRIAVNTAHNHLTAQQRRPQERRPSQSEGEEAELNPEHPDHETPERHLAGEQAGRAVLCALEDLPEALKTTILLRELEGLSYEEIAHITDCPIGTVRSRIFRAREFINARLEPVIE